MQIQFLGSGDLRNVLLTVSKLTNAYKKLTIHLNDECDIVTARNILMTNIILSNRFDPDNPNDVSYLWDVWYSLQWTECNRKRFIKDVKDLLTSQTWSDTYNIEPDSVEVLNNFLHHWLAIANKKTNVPIKNINTI